jgi:N-acetylmuramoyl-L-alanine amidase
MFDTLVWHYTATYEDQNIGAREIDAMHKARGWSGIGYHMVVRLDGTVENGRPLTRTGSHVGGQNTGKLGCVYIGGLKRATGPNIGFDTRTDAQKRAMTALTLDMLTRYPTIQRVVGHMDLAATQCPGFDVRAWWGTVKSGIPVNPSPPYAGNPVVSYPTLRRGSKGAQVRTLQGELNKRGARLVVDGDFGGATDTAVRAFQRSQRLEADGIVGPATWAALYASS